MIYDINGRKILNETFNKYLVNIDISNYNKGIYIIKVTGSNEVIWSGKFIKD